MFFFFSSRRRHTRFDCDWSSDVCSSDLEIGRFFKTGKSPVRAEETIEIFAFMEAADESKRDRKSTRLNSSHSQISYAVFCLKKKKTTNTTPPLVLITNHRLLDLMNEKT